MDPDPPAVHTPGMSRPVSFVIAFLDALAVDVYLAFRMPTWLPTIIGALVGGFVFWLICRPRVGDSDQAAPGTP